MLDFPCTPSFCFLEYKTKWNNEKRRKLSKSPGAQADSKVDRSFYHTAWGQSSSQPIFVFLWSITHLHPVFLVCQRFFLSLCMIFHLSNIVLPQKCLFFCHWDMSLLSAFMLLWFLLQLVFSVRLQFCLSWIPAHYPYHLLFLSSR